MVIEICETNETAKLINQLRITFHDADIVAYACLNRCAGCFLCYVALIDGVLIEAISAEQLLHKILASLQTSQSN
ncbi:hypothetical protein CIG75_08490 [Tumebacillus algifaecis]|uniref:DUF1450 domain-containing protein n=1 Tax=Tumebacillus algifaecis TaxID=1214604 RepID=A0A223D0E8_9BACL|nr:DUF1450 domain-containing protein [Tumebacillus algifaecis]ASS75021.1 hypothetical protein CIG75_08490 [Tumebacillus algifaecis]